jgi:hypothetical protein
MMLAAKATTTNFLLKEDMMSEEAKRCQATTKAGTQCKNKAQDGSEFCYVHRDEKMPAISNTEFEALVAELNSLAAEVKAMENAYAPPPFSPQGMIKLLKQNMDKFTPDMRLSILGELQQSFEGAEAKDFLDPDTWKGMWYLLNYSVENNTEGLRESLGARLASLPGYELATDIGNSLQGASPKDFLDVDTWKGIWYMVNYSLKFEAEKMKARILGEEEEEF